MAALVDIERDGHILTIRINRPEKKNALTTDMYAAMADAIAGAESDTSVRVIVITGTNGCFTAGNDLKDFLERPPRDKTAPVYRFILALVQSTVPIVAAVDGVAVGIGTTMLLHCDRVFATPNARFQMPFVNLGLLPEAGSTYLLPKLLGYAKAAELVMTGDPFDAETAVELGIVSRICPAEALEESFMAVARELAEKPPAALRKTKALLKGDQANVLDRIQWEMLEFAECLDSPECKEALSAFQEKRRPDFSK